ncbi:MAG: outer membrane beta-barrel protein [Syntrophales bacterium]|nr:outer membrane beta-barrel protein [Syntrophales bacterium]
MIAGTAFGDKGPYIGAQAGVAFMRDSKISDPTGSGKVKLDTGFSTGLHLGYDFKAFRLEGELRYQESKVDKVSACAGGICVSDVPASGNFTVWSLLVNGYYGFLNESPVTPYLTAGIGVAKLDVDNLSVLKIRLGSADDVVFAYQVGAGIGLSLVEKTTLDVKYRYFATTDPDFKGIKA